MTVLDFIIHQNTFDGQATLTIWGRLGPTQEMFFNVIDASVVRDIEWSLNVIAQFLI